MCLQYCILCYLIKAFLLLLWLKSYPDPKSESDISSGSSNSMWFHWTKQMYRIFNNIFKTRGNFTIFLYYLQKLRDFYHNFYNIWKNIIQIFIWLSTWSVTSHQNVLREKRYEINLVKNFTRRRRKKNNIWLKHLFFFLIYSN